jgi:hypothetical protein
MPLWVNNDQASSAPKNERNVATNIANGSVLYGNTVVGAFTANVVVGEYGITAAEQAATGKIAHSGWNLLRLGTGPVTGFNTANSGKSYAPSDYLTVSSSTANAVNATANLVLANTGPINSIAVNVAGLTYNNTDLGTISGGTVNATFSLTTNATGGVTAVTLGTGANTGNGFANASVAVVSVTNATGGATGGSGLTLTITVNSAPGYITGFSNVNHGGGFTNTSVLTLRLSNSSGGNSTAGGANGTQGSFTAILGGRASRVWSETLVALGSMSNTANSATLPTPFQS